jgi:hypothetical protein
MTNNTAAKKYESAKDRREWLIQSLRAHVLPVLIRRGFELAPLITRGPIDRELVRSLPLGRLRRSGEKGVDLIQIELPRYHRAAFRIAAGVAPKEGLMTHTGHWDAEDLYVGWLNEFYGMYALPRWRVSFFVWHWRNQSPTQGDYERLAQRVAGFVPELELALREGTSGPHMRRFVIPRPPSKVGGNQSKEPQAST